jgi:hypothetical protein
MPSPHPTRCANGVRVHFMTDFEHDSCRKPESQRPPLDSSKQPRQIAPPRRESPTSGKLPAGRSQWAVGGPKPWIPADGLISICCEAGFRRGSHSGQTGFTEIEVLL